MENEFVSYEQAVALRELGFDEVCFGGYDKADEVLLVGYDTDAYEHFNRDFHIPAPLKQQVFRWFREYYWWYANLSSWLQEEEGTYHEYEIYGTPDSAHGSIMFKTYEEAENACIDKLIELAKQQGK